MSALFLSGAAGLVNQVVWQRALKLFLGGSETISALVVVLVFMLGLGLGSLFLGFRVRRIEDPCRLLVITEIALVIVNLLIAWILSYDVSASVYAVQRFAVSAGIPLRLVYAVSALLILFVPCFLMGITLPLASETCQRQLGAVSSSVVDGLFAINTVGAVLGAYTSGFYLLPYVGQRAALVGAAGCNATAALVLTTVWLRVRRGASIEAGNRGVAGSSGLDVTESSVWRSVLSMLHGRIRREELIGLLLGFLSLGYEMYLIRLLALAHRPRPYTFSFVICTYLLTWSVGVALASRLKIRIGFHLIVAALLIACVPYYQGLVRPVLAPGFFAPNSVGLWKFGLAWSGVPYFLPCISFGILFGQVIRSYLKNWGHDVGRYSGLNTVGSCAGILVMTMLGFELHYDHAAWLLAGGLLLVVVVHLGGRDGRTGFFVGRVPRNAVSVPFVP
ncbi:MAG: hypothetical protein H6837_15290 [Planctomycetes bacterium]|nr:hypothetical protein [Planctomycetota bacterium]